MSPTIPAQGGGHQEVLQPVVVVAVPVQPLRRAAPAAVGPRRRRVPRPVVVQQGPAAAVLCARLFGAVQMLAVLEVPVHRPHQPVQHVAGAVPAGVAVRRAVLLGPRTTSGPAPAARRSTPAPAPTPTAAAQPLCETPSIRWCLPTVERRGRSATPPTTKRGRLRLRPSPASAGRSPTPGPPAAASAPASRSCNSAA